MNNVKENLKTISKQTTKMLLVDLSLDSGRRVLTNQIINFIPNPAVKTAVQVAGYVGYFVAANYFTHEEGEKIADAMAKMIVGDKYEKELEKRLNEAIEMQKKIEEIYERNEEQDAE